MQSFDTIIVGGGHNGLVCAGYLARSGQKVLVLEASDVLGGLASTREFHPGFRVSVAHTLSHFSEQVAADLELARHGYQGPGDPLPTLGMDPGGLHVCVQGQLIDGVTEEDRRSYQAYFRLLRRCARALKPFWTKTMPRIGGNTLPELLTFARIGLKLRMLGKRDMREFLRIAALPARDLMDENFDCELLKPVLSWEGLVGSSQAPRSPNHTVLSMLYRMSGAHGGSHSVPAGGLSALVQALAASAESAGAELRTSTPVARIAIDASAQGLRAKGVVLTDDTMIEATRVVSSADPRRTFLQLVGVENLEVEFVNRIRRLRCDGFVAKLHLALSGLPGFAEVPDGGARMIFAAGMDTIEFAFDDAKYGRCPEQPVMEVLIPSVMNPSMAPEGQHVLSAHVMYIPCALKGGWTDDARQALCERLIDQLCVFAPDLRELILHAELLTPADLEQGWNVTGGHWHHTELALDQMLMMRPTYEAAQYRTPIPGLYLCGAGSHPGGGVMGAAGSNAAREVLK